MQTSETRFSKHAFFRTSERLSLKLNEIVDILDNNLTVNVSSEKGTNRIHRMFFSEFDNQCFVAIQDQRDKTIVTILPIDYYEQIVCKIPDELFAEAKKLAARRNKNLIEPSVFKIVGVIEPRRFVNIKSWLAFPYNNSVEQLLHDKNFLPVVRRQISGKLQEGEILVGLQIKLGCSGEPIYVNVEEKQCLQEKK